MLVVQTYKENAEQFSGLTFVLDFEVCKKRLRLYYKNVGAIKARLISGERIDIPFVTLQKDRRIRDIKVSNERREPVKSVM